MAQFDFNKIWDSFSEFLRMFAWKLLVPAIKNSLALLLVVFLIIWNFSGLRFLFSAIFTEKIDERKRIKTRFAPFFDRLLVHWPLYLCWEWPGEEISDNRDTIWRRFRNSDNLIQRFFLRAYKPIYTRLPSKIAAYAMGGIITIYPISLALHQLGVGTAENRYNTNISMLASELPETQIIALKDLPGVAFQKIPVKPKINIPTNVQELRDWSLLKFFTNEQVPYEDLVVKVSEHVREQLPRYAKSDSNKSGIEIKNFRLDYLQMNSDSLHQNGYTLKDGYMDKLILRNSMYHRLSISDCDIPLFEMDEFYGSYITLDNLNNQGIVGVDTTRFIIKGDGFFCHDCNFKNLGNSIVENPYNSPIIFSFSTLDSAVLDWKNIYYYETQFYSDSGSLSHQVSNISEEQLSSLIEMRAVEKLNLISEVKDIRVFLDNINDHYKRSSSIIYLNNFH